MASQSHKQKRLLKIGRVKEHTVRTTLFEDILLMTKDATDRKNRFPQGVADDDVIYLPAAKLADGSEVGHHVQIIEGKHHERDADVLRAGDLKEMRGTRVLSSVARPDAPVGQSR